MSNVIEAEYGFLICKSCGRTMGIRTSVGKICAMVCECNRPRGIPGSNIMIL